MVRVLKDTFLKFSCSIFVLFFVTVVLVGCAGQKPVVEPSAPADSATAEAPRDSLRAKFLLTIVQKDSATGKDVAQELDAVIFSVPGKRYRMELTGPLGIGVASLLWQEEGWQMTFPTEKLYMKGVGYMVGPTRVEGAVYAREKMGRPFTFRKEGDHVSWLSRMGRGGKTETIRFYDFKEFEGVETPSRIVFELDGARFLEIRIKKVTRNKSFSSGTWRLNIPKSFKKVGE